MSSKIKYVFIVTAKGYNTNGLVLAKGSGKLKGLVHGKYTAVRVYSLKRDRVSPGMSYGGFLKRNEDIHY